jgi:hypothetical protein
MKRMFCFKIRFIAIVAAATAVAVDAFSLPLLLLLLLMLLTLLLMHSTTITSQITTETTTTTTIASTTTTETITTQQHQQKQQQQHKQLYSHEYANNTRKYLHVGIFYDSYPNRFRYYCGRNYQYPRTPT